MAGSEPAARLAAHRRCRYGAGRRRRARGWLRRRARPAGVASAAIRCEGRARRPSTGFRRRGLAARPAARRRCRDDASRQGRARGWFRWRARPGGAAAAAIRGGGGARWLSARPGCRGFGAVLCRPHLLARPLGPFGSRAGADAAATLDSLPGYCPGPLRGPAGYRETVVSRGLRHVTVVLTCRISCPGPWAGVAGARLSG